MASGLSDTLTATHQQTRYVPVTNTPTAPSRPAKKREAFLPFLPKFMSGTKTLRWLKRVHAWTGLWGALIFLMMGTSGFLLNHRSTAKIDTGAPKEVSSVVLEVDPAEIGSKEALGLWAQDTFGTSITPRASKAEPAGQGKGESAVFMNTDVTPVEVWTQSFKGPNGSLLVEYAKGSTTVTAKRTAENVFGLIKNMHKGSGLGILWVLFIDLTAGALITMSLTGALLWSQLHGPRLAAIGIASGCLALGLFASLPSFI